MATKGMPFDTKTKDWKDLIEAVREADRDARTHQHNPYLALGAGCIGGALLGLVPGIVIGIGISVVAVVHHEYSTGDKEASQ